MTKITTVTAVIIMAALAPLSALAQTGDMMTKEAKMEKSMKDDSMMKPDTMMKHDSMVKDMATDKATDKAFTKKKYAIKGSWSVVTENGQTIIRLSDDFKTKRGPDLKLFLSPTDFDAVSGANATAGSISLGALKSNKGASDYVVPAGVDLSLYQSVLIHCEAYSVLWGGGAL